MSSSAAATEQQDDAASIPTSRPPFNPVDTSFNPSEHSHKDSPIVESPSLSSGNALARFEFSSGQQKNCTKILLIEWQDDESTSHIPGDWEISWEGSESKKTVLPAKDQQSLDSNGGVNRLYFLLGPSLSIPATVQLSKGETVRWKTNPLPAIFSPELGVEATAAGKKGVLHTIWAKKRVQVLRGEIEEEERRFGEGTIAGEMALKEMEWIEGNFGVSSKTSGSGITTAGSLGESGLGIQTSGGGSAGPASPRSPGGGRLMDKLKGLKIGTSERELSSPATTVRGNDDAAPAYNPLSPESSDVAVGSFGSFAQLKGMPSPSASELAAKPPQPPPPATQRKMAAQSPPESFAAQQRQQQQGAGGAGSSGMGSLNAFASPEIGFPSSSQHPPAAARENEEKKDDDDDLFALPMSPRSPEMSKSPFSFAVGDTGKYEMGERAR